MNCPDCKHAMADHDNFEVEGRPDPPDYYCGVVVAPGTDYPFCGWCCMGKR